MLSLLRYAHLWFALGALVPASGYAHHSSDGVYDAENTAQLIGTVTRFDWRNPHLYIHVTTTDEEGISTVWRIEGRPLAFMRRIGWSSDTLLPGDRVTATISPSRISGKPRGLLKDIVVDGREIPPIQGEAVMRQFVAPEVRPEAKATSLAGTWVTIPNQEALKFVNEPDGHALTKAGVEAIEEFDQETMHPGLACIPFTAPALMVIPDTKKLEVLDDSVVIRSDFDGAIRTVYLDDRESIEATIQGHSLGRWEGGILVIETSDFVEHRMGNAFSLPSGSRKKLVERLELSVDGKSLSYSFELSDSDYLAEPVVGKANWVYQPDVLFSSLACDLENARMYLDD